MGNTVDSARELIKRAYNGHRNLMTRGEKLRDLCEAFDSQDAAKRYIKSGFVK